MNPGPKIDFSRMLAMYGAPRDDNPGHYCDAQRLWNLRALELDPEQHDYSPHMTRDQAAQWFREQGRQALIFSFTADLGTAQNDAKRVQRRVTLAQARLDAIVRGIPQEIGPEEEEVSQKFRRIVFARDEGAR